MSALDRLAVRERIEAYNDAVFRRDADDWAACWAEDALWLVGGVTTTGRAAIRAHWLARMAEFSAVGMHVNHGVIEVDGDAAGSRCYMLEMLTKVDGTELLVSGRYDDRLARGADGVWRFAERRYAVLQARRTGTG